jgi:hypothetical protein
MRANLPNELSKICATLALNHGEQGPAERAALHAALVIHIHGDTVGPQRALEACATPELKRRLADAFEVVHRNALSGEHHTMAEVQPAAPPVGPSDFKRSYRLLAAANPAPLTPPKVTIPEEKKARSGR